MSYLFTGVTSSEKIKHAYYFFKKIYNLLDNFTQYHIRHQSHLLHITSSSLPPRRRLPWSQLNARTAQQKFRRRTVAAVVAVDLKVRFLWNIALDGTDRTASATTTVASGRNPHTRQDNARFQVVAASTARLHIFQMRFGRIELNKPYVQAGTIWSKKLM